ncbi:hypothetical protein [Stieleria mannarensis]|uniref:hypothetical protein n=1 Tax=Stieleria mannarensis TaxID=2755585 RepID=UPI0015FF2B7C|nr:hypothetical protein [Rhodopirellula sp. JC639]
MAAGYAVAATGDNAVYLNPDGTGLQHAASLRDRSYGFFDLAVGCFVYQNDDGNLLTAVIPTAEIHHTSSLDKSGIVTAGNLQVGDFLGSTSLTSAAIGTTFEHHQQSQLTIGYAVPRASTDRQCDGAFRFQFSRQLH